MTTETVRELRFFLSTSSEVAESPSIGPKTASRLKKVGVYTVRDLIDCDPEAIAERLDQRRIKSEHIEAWQRQAELVCRIPELRGHDAQLLVGCDVTDVDEIAAMNPRDLFALVKPFSETKEGVRILRNGKQPTLEEVTDWITWAQQGRTLRNAA